MICVETYPISVRWILMSELTDYWCLIIDLLDHWPCYEWNTDFSALIDWPHFLFMFLITVHQLSYATDYWQFQTLRIDLSQLSYMYICHDFSQVLWLFIFDVIFNNIPSFDFNSLISHACPRKASQEKKSLPMAKYLGNRKSPIIKKVLAHKTWETTFCHCYI